MQIEDELRRALRAEDPGAAFTQRVLARAREERARGSRVGQAATGDPERTSGQLAQRLEARAVEGPRTVGEAAESAAPQVAALSGAWTARRIVAALAASLAIAAGSLQWVEHRRYVAEGERARAQVLTALRLTSEQLKHVHQAIHPSSDAR